jgi:hypothetical protein
MNVITSRRFDLGRKAMLFLVWIGGYVLGAFAWLVRVPLIQFIGNLGLSSDATQALVAGLFGSSVMVLAVLLFSFLSSSS